MPFGNCPLGLIEGIPIISSLTSLGASTLLDAISKWIGNAAAFLVEKLGQIMENASQPGIGTSWFSLNYQNMIMIAGLVIVPLIFISVIRSIFMQDFNGMGKMVMIQIPGAFIAGIGSIQIVKTLIEIVDSFSNQLLAQSGSNFPEMISRINSALISPLSSMPTIASGALAFIALGILSGTLVLFIEMIMRSSAIDIAVLFLPISFAAMVFPYTAHILRRLIETIASLILSKFVVAGVLAMASSEIASNPYTSSFSTITVGLACIWLAAFSPFMLFKIVPLVDASVLSGITEVGQRVHSRGKEMAKIAVGAGIDSYLATTNSSGSVLSENQSLGDATSSFLSQMPSAVSNHAPDNSGSSDHFSREHPALVSYSDKSPSGSLRLDSEGTNDIE
ncbi:MAG: hypothetical protein HKL80_03465 [Acidimicrobiales bacterium]|nr:hypothetical protein [Acidimicrobiales bacterium]